MKHMTQCEAQAIGGSVQQATLFFTVAPPGIRGLRIIRKTYKGILGPFHDDKEMGDYEPGAHSYSFPPETVPDGFLQRGSYKTHTDFVDGDGKVLVSYLRPFRIVKLSHFQNCTCVDNANMLTISIGYSS
jgi:hypothetical protein